MTTPLRPRTAADAMRHVGCFGLHLDKDGILRCFARAHSGDDVFVADLTAEAAPDLRAALDYDAMRVAREWPTPNHMRQVADALDTLTPARYGDVLRWFADRCDEWVWAIGVPQAKERLEQARAALVAPAADGDEWEWYGDSPIGQRHGAGDGWLHIHPDGSRWVHPEKTCPLLREPSREPGERS